MAWALSVALPLAGAALLLSLVEASWGNVLAMVLGIVVLTAGLSLFLPPIVRRNRGLRPDLGRLFLPGVVLALLGLAIFVGAVVALVTEAPDPT